MHPRAFVRSLRFCKAVYRMLNKNLTKFNIRIPHWHAFPNKPKEILGDRFDLAVHTEKILYLAEQFICRWITQELLSKIVQKWRSGGWTYKTEVINCKYEEDFLGAVSGNNTHVHTEANNSITVVVTNPETHFLVIAKTGDNRLFVHANIRSFNDLVEVRPLAKNPIPLDYSGYCEDPDSALKVQAFFDLLKAYDDHEAPSSLKALSDKTSPRCLRQPTDHYLLAFDPKFEERRDRQQYFYSRKTADLIIEAILQHFYHDYERIEKEFVCLCAPSIAEILYREYSISVTLLDIDTRFNWLPKFQYFDLLTPAINCPNSFSFVLFDPPYFGLPFAALSGAVSLIASVNAQLLVGFLKRDERLLFDYFPTLRKTTAPVEYDRVKPSRWINYGLYSNCDLKGIRRAHEGKSLEKKTKERKKK